MWISHIRSKWWKTPCRYAPSPLIRGTLFVDFLTFVWNDVFMNIWGVSPPSPRPNFFSLKKIGEKNAFFEARKFQHLVRFSIFLFVLRTRSYDNVARFRFVSNFWIDYEGIVKLRDIWFHYIRNDEKNPPNPLS